MQLPGQVSSVGTRIHHEVGAVADQNFANLDVQQRTPRACRLHAPRWDERLTPTAPTEFLRDLGIHHHELVEDGLAFAVRSMEIDFIAAARIDDLLTVTTEVLEAGGVRLVLSQTILREDKVITTAKVQVVTIKTSGGPARLPADLRARLVPSTA